MSQESSSLSDFPDEPDSEPTVEQQFTLPSATPSENVGGAMFAPPDNYDEQTSLFSFDEEPVTDSTRSADFPQEAGVSPAAGYSTPAYNYPPPSEPADVQQFSTPPAAQQSSGPPYLAPPSGQQSGQHSPYQPGMPAHPPYGSSSGKGGLIAVVSIVVALVLLGAGIGTFFLLRDNGDGGSSSSNSDNHAQGNNSDDEADQAVAVLREFEQALEDGDTSALSGFFCSDPDSDYVEGLTQTIENKGPFQIDYVVGKKKKLSDTSYEITMNGTLVSGSNEFTAPSVFTLNKEDGEWKICKIE